MEFVYNGLEKVLYNGNVYVLVSKNYYAEYEDWLLELKHIEVDILIFFYIGCAVIAIKLIF